MVEKAFDQRGTASRVDTRFEELKNDEIENDKWVNGQAAGFFKTVNARNTETKQEKKHQEKKAKRAEVQTKAGMTDDEIKKINPSFIGRNSDGQMLFKDDKGVRYRMDGRIRISEPLTVGLSREKGVSLQPDRSAHSEFQTKEETESAQPASRSVDDIIASAASHGVKGVGESFKALYDLLGGGALKSGPLAFDEDTYGKEPTLKELGRLFTEFQSGGVSRERVRQLALKGLSKLADPTFNPVHSRLEAHYRDSIDLPPAEPSRQAVSVQEADDPRLRLPISQLDLPLRTQNLLTDNGIRYVVNLLRTTRKELMGILMMNNATIASIYDALEKIGFVRGERKSALPDHPSPETPASTVGSSPTEPGQGSIS